MRPRPVLCLQLLLVALASACGSDAPGAPREQVSLLGEPPQATSFSRGAWVEGEAWLHAGIRATGGVRIEATLEGEGPSTLLDEAQSSSSFSTDLPIPGKGPRAVRFDVTTRGRTEWLSLSVVSEPEPPLPRGEALAGELAGRDVVVILMDSLHAAHLSSYGYGRTTSANLDALAAAGVRFEAASSQTSWTLPSVTSLFTSVEQERHGVIRMQLRLGEELTTLAELFQGAGYDTLGIIQNGVVSRLTGLDRGFDEYHGYKWSLAQTRELLAQARRALLAEDRPPLFLYLHLTPPHQPYHPPPPHNSAYVDPEYEGKVDGSIMSCAVLKKEGLPRDHPDVRQLEALYDGHIKFVDSEIGALLDDVRAARGTDGLFVLATSDHGEAFMEHGTQGHNAHVYQEMVHVPLIFYAPGSSLPTDAVIDTPVSLLDIMPTMVELFGLGSTRQTMRGASLTGLLEGAKSEHVRPLFLTSRYRAGGLEPQFGVRVGDFKLVKGDQDVALYDLSTDAAESNDKSAEFPVLVDALLGELERWRAAAEAERARVEARQMNAETREEIRALGYGGDEEYDER